MSEIYRNTELGKIPESWEVVSLGDVATFSQGIQVDVDKQYTEKKEGYVRFLRIIDYTQNNGEVRYVEHLGERYFAKSDDIVMIRYGTPGIIGRRLEGIIANNMFKINFNDAIDKDFAEQYFKYSNTYRRIINGSGSSTMPAINFSFLRTFKIIIPPITEQKIISKFLNTVDEKIAVIAEQINATEELKKGLMQHLLTKGIGHTNFKDSPLGVIPTNWEIVQLDSIIQPDRGITYGIVQPGQFDESGRYLVRGKDYSNGWAKPADFFRVSKKIEEPYKRARLKENDLITTIVGAGVGNMEIVPKWLEGANITQTTARIAIDSQKADYKFYYYVLSSHIGKANVRNFEKGGAQPGLNLADIKKYTIPLLPIDEQKKISDILSIIDEKLKCLSLKNITYRDYKKGLMQQLLTGKIRVKLN